MGLNIVYFLGALGLFIYSFRVFSQNLQSLSSGLVRNLINRITENYFSVFFIGFCISLLIQSNSVFSLVLLGFVNAGLMSLHQFLVLLMGGAFGLVSTSWLLSFEFKSAFAYLLAIGTLPAILWRRNRENRVIHLFFSLGLVYFSMEFLSVALDKLPHTWHHFLNLQIASPGYYLHFLAIALLSFTFNLFIRSSSLMLALTIIIQQQYGMSTSCILASLMGIHLSTGLFNLFFIRELNMEATRASVGAAFFHILSFVFFLVFAQSVVSVFQHFHLIFSEKSPLLVALMHTIYSLFGVILFSALYKIMYNSIILFVPEAKHKEAKKLKLLGKRFDAAPGLAIELAEQEMKKMAAMVQSLLDHARSYIMSVTEDKAAAKKVLKYEKITDKIEQELVKYMQGLMEYPLNSQEASRLRSLLTISDELEGIGDSGESLIRAGKKLHKTDINLNPKLRKILRSFSAAVTDYYFIVFTEFTGEKRNLDDIAFDKVQSDMKEFKREFQSLLNADEINVDESVLANEIYDQLKKIKNHSYVIHNALK